jgi:hypothetical protein
MQIVLSPKTLGAIAGVIGSLVVIGSGSAWAYNTAIEAFDSRYVTIAGLQKLFNDRDLKILKKQIKEYEWLKNHGGGLTERQEWELGEMYDELEEMPE